MVSWIYDVGVAWCEQLKAAVIHWVISPVHPCPAKETIEAISKAIEWEVGCFDWFVVATHIWHCIGTSRVGGANPTFRIPQKQGRLV